MNIEKGKISGSQLMFLVAGLIQGSIFLLAYTEGTTKQDTWLVVLSGLAVTIPFALSYASLAKRFPGMNLVQINDAVYGKYAGKAISISYICYFLLVLSFNIRFIGDFYVAFLMSETPTCFFLIMFTLACAFAVWKGIEVLARVSPLFVATAFFILISTFLMLLNTMNFSNFLPVFEVPIRKFIQGTHIVSAIPFGEIVIFLTVMGNVNDTKYITKNVLLGLALGGVSFLIIAVRNTAVLGSTQAILLSPSFQTARLIEVGNVFTRMDVLIGIAQTIMIFLKCSLFYYAAIVSLSQLLCLKNYLPLILPIGGIAVILALIDWESSAQVGTYSLNTSPIMVIPFIYILPPLTLLIAKIRKLSRKEEDEKR